LSTQRPEGRKEGFDLEERLLNYAAAIVRLTAAMPATRAGAHVADQLLRAGTSALPNHGEAQAAESPADFIHKLSIGLKELRESRRWLLLIQRVPLIREPDQVGPLLAETEELIRIFYRSIQTARNRRSPSKLP
jgi:four helix bundle protein